MRIYESPSSIELADRCEYAYGLQYIEKLRDPEVEWAEIEAERRLPWDALARGDFPWTDNEKDPNYGKFAGIFQERGWKKSVWSRALGTELHAYNETWFTGGKPNWKSFVGRIAFRGLHHLPHPSRIREIRVEEPIGRTPLPPHEDPTRKDAPAVGLQYEAPRGSIWVGFVDLRCKIEAKELARLGIKASPDEWVTFDYKTTAGERYVKTVEELTAHPQPNLYAYDALVEDFEERIAAGTHARLLFKDDRKHPMRWLYYATRGKPNVWPVDFALTFTQASAKLQELDQHARGLRRLRVLADCVRDTESCPAFAGCGYHVDRGGPCDGRRHRGFATAALARRAALTETEVNMGWQEQFKNRKAQATSEPEVEQTEDAPESEAPESEAPESEPPPPPPKKPAAGKTPAATKTPPAAKPPVTKVAPPPSAKAAADAPPFKCTLTIEGSITDLRDLLSGLT